MRRAALLLPLPLALVACHHRPNPPDVPVGPDTAYAAMDPGTCDAVKAASQAIATHADEAPPDFLVASGADWSVMATAYLDAKDELERCVDAALEMTFADGDEIWDGMPAILGTAHPSQTFDTSDPASAYTDAPVGHTQIMLETISLPTGAELRLVVQ